ncbi:MAG: GAP family protein [Candidatus Pacebacteria bacterium]|nr:GAP family protein [Candidatus Paceibacterota bacterium]MDD3072171.1 GAP family protein [Candidatus Paceibacterota bacterium]MDD3728764.1 GAP family protein [Candidatus Paceibacterota bacterium]MDD4201377.1 GAP family protein [Candidatus Paceibacterota bacterium]MDD4466935.1 GAP family protein [Candidatus Paceibacterota bacterium]
MFQSIDISSPFTMIPIVMTTGFLDGIHPCAIAILIFFIAFLLTMQKAFRNIFFLGLVYIFVIFLTYLAVGVGLLSGITFFGQHHFFAKFGAWLLIFLGLIHLKEYFFPNLPFHLRMPKFSSEKIKTKLEKATLSGIIIAAFLVGLCSIPCSGGIYAAITALLASKTTYLSGLLYLLLYNFMFVLPLFILLLFAANPLTLSKIARFRQKNERTEGLIMGLLVLLLGIGILIFIL